MPSVSMAKDTPVERAEAVQIFRRTLAELGQRIIDLVHALLDRGGGAGLAEC